MRSRSKTRSARAIEIIAFLTFLSGATIAEGGDRAIWDIYPMLTCRYDQAQSCEMNMKTCDYDVGSAVLEFNFNNDEIKSFAARDKFKITAKYHHDSGSFREDSNSVFAEGSLYSFLKITKGSMPSDADSVEGVVQNAGAERAFAIHMTCHPD